MQPSGRNGGWRPVAVTWGRTSRTFISRPASSAPIWAIAVAASVGGCADSSKPADTATSAPRAVPARSIRTVQN
jgi:hypothetical protein